MRNRAGREFREIREIREIKEYREEVIYSANTLAIFPKFLKFPILLIFPNHPPPNFLSEWCRCGADQLSSAVDQFRVRSHEMWCYQPSLAVDQFRVRSREMWCCQLSSAVDQFLVRVVQMWR